MYKDLAWTWPIISPPEDYAEEAEQFRKAILDHSTIPVKTLLDIGCGGGHIDFHLKKWFDVTGVDLNEGMLENARKLNPDVTYMKGDMRSLDLDVQFDTVIIADSILYMQNEEELKAAFETARKHLKPGGVFVTYAEQTVENFVNHSTHVLSRARDDLSVILFEYLFDIDPTDTMFESIFVYIINREGKVEVELDHHAYGLFPQKTWERLLKETGFGVSRISYDADDGYPMFVGLKPSP